MDRISLNKAIFLRKTKPRKALEILMSFYKKNKKNAYVNYEIARTYDSLGKETMAITFYKKAIDIGLGDELEDALICLGSSYRCVGEYEKSIRVFNRGVRLFPKSVAIKIFRALTLYNLKRNRESIVQILLIFLGTTKDRVIKKYEKSIRFYLNNLDNIWKG